MLGNVYLPLNVTSPIILIKLYLHFPDSNGQSIGKLFLSEIVTNNLYRTSKAKANLTKLQSSFSKIGKQVISQNPHVCGSRQEQ